ncbi:hypothetical protein KW411_16360 [Vibrio fluvialis]|nr:hypothetical protein [Vibrio fluvialis]
MTIKSSDISLLFSIAIHESEDSVYDLINNINYFCINPIIILHIPKYSSLDLKLTNYDNVFVNETNFMTGYADGTLTFVHLENFIQGEKLKLNYDYFIPFGSNQLFIKGGIEEYVLGAEKSECPLPEKNDFQNVVYNRDEQARAVFGEIARKSAPEGTFYRKMIIDRIINDKKGKLYFNNNRWVYTSGLGLCLRRFSGLFTKVLVKLGLEIFIPSFLARFSYATEEIVFPSIDFNGLTKKRYCYIPWHRNDIRVTVDDVRLLIEKDDHYFSVKRVERTYDDETRTFIREQLGNNYCL